MSGPDEIMIMIGRGIALREQGEPAAARALFADLWRQIGADGDPLHRCALAHSMADVQPDPADEVWWDLRALEAADQITDERARRAGSGPVSSFYPSLHLNLGEAYRKLGDPRSAERHLRRGLDCVRALPDDGYGRMITRGLAGLSDRLQRPGEIDPREREG